MNLRTTCAVVLALSIGSTALPAYPASAVALETLATTDVNGLEGLDVTADGTLYVTNAVAHVLHKVTPDGQVTEFAKLPVAPQVVLVTRGGLILTSQAKDPDFSAFPKPGSAGPPVGGPGVSPMGSLDARVLVLDRQGKLLKSIEGPAGSFFNGFDRFGKKYLIADSTAGVIWLLDPDRGTVEPWLRDPLLAPAQGHFPGANGLKVVKGTIYVSNTSGGAIYRIASDPSGKPSGSLRLVANIAAPDDFAVAADGTIYAPSGAKILKISPDGAVSTLAEGCGGCDAALLADHDRVLYLVTHGFGPNGGRGHVYKIALEH
jgi:sugar lactone lactonase YvrE